MLQMLQALVRFVICCVARRCRRHRMFLSGGKLCHAVSKGHITLCTDMQVLCCFWKSVSEPPRRLPIQMS